MSAIDQWLRAVDPFPRTVRIGVTGLARAGKTSFLAAVAANLLAAGAGLPVLPALSARLAGRHLAVRPAASRADGLAEFALGPHLGALAADPPRWPARTSSASLLALDLEIGRGGIAGVLPPRTLHLEFLDYPGEWLLDLPLLAQDFSTFSDAQLARLAPLPAAARFLDFVGSLGAAAADPALVEPGCALYRAALHALRAQGMVLLQPGRFLMPAPGEAKPFEKFFPLPPAARAGPLGTLLAERYDAYRRAVRAELEGPHFGRVDRLVVLADLLSALHAGAASWRDAEAALGAVARGFHYEWWRRIPGLDLLFGPAIGRVAFAATKADHVAERQRGNLAALVGRLTVLPEVPLATAAFAIAAVRCTEDFVWTLEGRPVSAVRGRVLGTEVLTRSYPGEVPDRPPDGAAFFEHPFLALPEFEPPVLPDGGRGGVPHLGLDRLLAFLLEDFL